MILQGPVRVSRRDVFPRGAVRSSPVPIKSPPYPLGTPVRPDITLPNTAPSLFAREIVTGITNVTKNPYPPDGRRMAPPGFFPPAETAPSPLLRISRIFGSPPPGEFPPLPAFPAFRPAAVLDGRFFGVAGPAQGLQVARVLGIATSLHRLDMVAFELAAPATAPAPEAVALEYRHADPLPTPPAAPRLSAVHRPAPPMVIGFRCWPGVTREPGC